MKMVLSLAILSLLFYSCAEPDNMSSLDPINWEKRRASIDADSTLEKGSTYLSVYSEIYSLTEHRTHNLTATVSLRNVNVGDTIFIESAEYFNTHGESIRNYIQNSIFIAPLETVEIVIDEQDKTGGTGANFIFNWAIQPGSNPPLFEGVMISTSGQQGLSFTTQGHILK